MWAIIKRGNWQEEYEKEEELFEFVSDLQNKLAKSIYDFLNESCASHLIGDSFRMIWSDSFIEFTYHVINNGEDYYNKCVSIPSYCLEESKNYKSKKS